MDEEGVAILKMLEDGKITVAEAKTMLEEIRQPARPSQSGKGQTDVRLSADKGDLHSFRRNLPESEELSRSDNKLDRRGQGQGLSHAPGREQGTNRGLGPRRAHGRSRRGKG